MKQSARNEEIVLEAIKELQTQLIELNRKVDTLMNRSGQQGVAQTQKPSVPVPSVPAPKQSSNDRHKGRPMFTVICADCKKECTIPFKPNGDRPVYCKDCFSKRKVITMSGVKFDDKPKQPEAVSLAPVVQKEEAVAPPKSPTKPKKKSSPVKKTVTKKKTVSKKAKKK